jgi:glycerophosphoryl diester phosphodiesterase
LVDPSLVERAHQAGLAVNVWTVDDPDRIAELTRMGVDGIVTNDVATGRRVVDEVLSE